MSPRTDVSVERRAQILDAASNVFARKGFDQASMDEIVDESGLSKGALYWYFKSKDQIIAAVLDRMFAPELDQLNALARAEGTARERLLQFAAITVRELKRMSRLIPITYEFYALALRDKSVQKSMKAYLRAYYAALIPVIEQGMAGGEFRALDAAQVAVALGAVVEGSVLLWVLDPKSVDLEAQLMLGIQLALDGLSVGAGSQTQ